MSEAPDESEDSGLRWEDVSLPASVSVADLDALIFHDLVQSWRKVARIVGRAQMVREARSLPISGEVIAARVRALTPEHSRVSAIFGAGASAKCA
jgi:hypothetical protein